jgi:hypothetical protein
MTKKRKGSVSEETFDDFLASEGMLEACEEHAIREMQKGQRHATGATLIRTLQASRHKEVDLDAHRP